RGTELIEVAGDRKSIGGWQREERRIFTDHKIDIRSGDMIYLSSDGYVDQADAEGRRFGSRRLKDLLVEIAGYGHARQSEVLLAELDSHQGLEDQRDDIAVVGVKI
ncbi:serine/threonine-protein phosphatase, partial [bacterium]|nr:serine/threonine-protein phosphatase [bacterium]